MKKVQIRCKMEKQKLTLIACSVPDFVPETFPALSHIFLTIIQPGIKCCSTLAMWKLETLPV
jgi:hypothetical protein